MRISLETPKTLSPSTKAQATELVAECFSRDNVAEIAQDTNEHLSNADFVQIAHDSQELVALAMYTRRLWRQGN